MLLSLLTAAALGFGGPEILPSSTLASSNVDPIVNAQLIERLSKGTVNADCFGCEFEVSDSSTGQLWIYTQTLGPLTTVGNQQLFVRVDVFDDPGFCTPLDSNCVELATCRGRVEFWPHWEITGRLGQITIENYDLSLGNVTLDGDVIAPDDTGIYNLIFRPEFCGDTLPNRVVQLSSFTFNFEAKCTPCSGGN